MTQTITPHLLDTTYCDRCGARAPIRYVLRSGLDLVLCHHHAGEHAMGLILAGATLEDTTFAVPTNA